MLFRTSSHSGPTEIELTRRNIPFVKFGGLKFLDTAHVKDLLALFRKDEFSYDPASDTYLCPARQRLFPYSSSLLRGLKKTNYVNKLACESCALRGRCTAGKFRAVSRLENEAVLDRMQARVATRPDIMDRRRETVEHPFGTIKQRPRCKKWRALRQLRDSK